MVDAYFLILFPFSQETHPKLFNIFNVKKTVSNIKIMEYGIRINVFFNQKT